MVNLIQYDPFINDGFLNREFKRALKRLVSDSDQSVVEGSRWAPSVDIQEETNQFVLYADIPGVDPNQIEVFMENGILTIRGERKTETKEEDVNFSRIERIAGLFERRFTLPDTADPEKVTAQGLHGVLKVMIPKREKAKAKKIVVQSK
jgi:HSP20 family protein